MFRLKKVVKWEASSISRRYLRVPREPALWKTRAWQGGVACSAAKWSSSTASKSGAVAVLRSMATGII